MKIGIFMYNYLPDIGGAQICAHCMADSFVRMGQEVIVYARMDALQACKSLGWNFSYKVRGVYKLPTLFLGKLPQVGRMLLAAQMKRLVWQDQLNVIQIFFSWPWITVADEVRAVTGVPIIVRCAGDDIQIDRSLGYGIQRDDKVREMQARGFMAIDKGVAISETVRSDYLAAGIADKKIAVIPPGVDFDAFASCRAERDTVRKKWKVPVDKKLIIGVGRNHPKKRFKDLVRALPSLNADANRFAVAVVGKNSDQLREEAQKLDVTESFFPIGEVASMNKNDPGTFPSRALIELYKASDYFVHPSFIETYANVALEAMAAGVPAIVTDAPGNIDTVEDGIDGLVVPKKSPQQIAEKILLLENDKTFKAGIIANGVNKAKSQDWRMIAEAYLEIYKEITA